MKNIGLQLACGLALLASLCGCGGNVVIDGSGVGGTSGTGGSGGVTSTLNACEQYIQDIITKYTQCGIEIGGTGGAPTCSPTDAQIAACLDDCLPLLDCACTKDPSGAGCADKLKPFGDCATLCVN